MKRNLNYLIFGLMSVVLSSVIFFFAPALPSIGFYAIFLLFCLGIFTIGTFFAPQTKYYNWDQIKEKKEFKILQQSTLFNENPEGKPYASIVLFIEGFGKTLVNFPTDKKFWNNKVPEKNQAYMIIGKKVIQIVQH